VNHVPSGEEEDLGWLEIGIFGAFVVTVLYHGGFTRTLDFVQSALLVGP
jgi:hypothetical protein